MKQPSNEKPLSAQPSGDLLEARHNLLLQEMRDTPRDGRVVRHLGLDFLVLPGVFPPYDDSIPLIGNISILSNESVLDVGSGSGVLSVFAAKRGARKVLAIDINPAAVRNTTENARLHGVSSVVQGRQSDLFANIPPGERFDVVLANLPFRNKNAPDMEAKSIWDTGFLTHRRFFSQVSRVLQPNGRMYLVHASFGNLSYFHQLAERAGFSQRLLEEYRPPGDELRSYYAYEFTRS